MIIERFRRTPLVAQLALSTLGYMLIARLSVLLGFAPGGVSPVWPLSGLTLAAIVIGGWQLIPAVLIGDALIGVIVLKYPILTSIGVAIATTLEPTVGAYILRTFINGLPRLDRLRDVLILIATAGVTPIVSSILAVLFLTESGIVLWAEYPMVAATWWVGDSLGILVFAPLLLNALLPNWQSVHVPPNLEKILFVVATTCATFLIFTYAGATFYLLLLLTTIAALRYGGNGASISTVMIAVIALERTLAGAGPFASNESTVSLITMQLFISVIAVTSLVLSATNRQRQYLAEGDALVADLSHTFYQSLDYQATLDLVSRRMAETMADWVAIDIVEGQQVRSATRVSADPANASLVERLHPYPARLFDKPRGQVGSVILAGKSIYIPVIRDVHLCEVAHNDDHLAILRSMGIQSSIITPLVIEQRFIGLISLHTSSRRRFLPEDVQLVEYIAVHAARAIENARLHSQLRDTLAQLDALLISVPVGVAFFDHDLTCRRINPALAQMIGVSEQQSVGQPLSHILPEATNSVHDMIAALEQASHTLQQREVTLTKTVAHEERTILMSAYQVHLGASSSGTGIVVVDLTIHRKMEQRLHESERLESIGRLSGGIAHDVNGILTVISGAVDLISYQEALSVETRTDLDTIRAAINRGHQLTRQLLSLARHRSRELRTLIFDEMVAEPVMLLSRLLPRSITLNFTPNAPSSYVTLDPTHFAQVIMNLGINSRDAMPNGGMIAITTYVIEIDDTSRHKHTLERSGTYIALEVTDSGHGMDLETQHRIFEPYFTTKRSGQGFGLGLATVYSIVRQSGGTISVRSVMGSGTTFTILIPTVAQPDGLELVVDGG